MLTSYRIRATKLGCEDTRRICCARGPSRALALPRVHNPLSLAALHDKIWLIIATQEREHSMPRQPIQWKNDCRFAVGSIYTESNEEPVQYTTPLEAIVAVLESIDPGRRSLQSRDQKSCLELHLEIDRISKVLTQLGLSGPTLSVEIP